MAKPLRISGRAQRVEPFYVLEMAKAAAELGQAAIGSDRPMVYLNIGEPDFTAPPLVCQAAEKALRDGATQYTAATGLPVLRERISQWYLGLGYDAQYGHSALAIDESVISVNSFSKYFSMTGWRLGWLVVPAELVPVIERLAQNLFICPSTIAQHAALACFEADSLAEYERRRSAFKARRDYLVPALDALGLQVPVLPDGAFYAWADCSQACARLGVKDSWELAFALMNQAHVAVTPGRDFGQAETAHFIRLSSASSMEQLQTAVARLKAVLA